MTRDGPSGTVVPSELPCLAAEGEGHGEDSPQDTPGRNLFIHKHLPVFLIQQVHPGCSSEWLTLSTPTPIPWLSPPTSSCLLGLIQLSDLQASCSRVSSIDFLLLIPARLDTLVYTWTFKFCPLCLRPVHAPRPCLIGLLISFVLSHRISSYFRV